MGIVQRPWRQPRTVGRQHKSSAPASRISRARSGPFRDRAWLISVRRYLL